jgi:L-malate glycosyltransferase
VKFCIFLVAPSELLTDHRPHGDGLVAFGFIRELGARGHELHVAAERVELCEALPANVHVHRFAEGGRTVPTSRLGFMRRVRRLYRRLERTTTFDLVHQLNPVEVGVSLALADIRVPLVLGPYVPDWPPSTPHPGAVDGPAVRRVKHAVRAAQQRRATAALLSTPAAGPKIARGARPRLQLHVLPPGIDDGLWVPAGAGTGQDVLVLANLEVRKGIHVAVDAFARLASDLPQARLLVAGAGPEAEVIRTRVDRLPARERVKFLGHVGREQAKASMQGCDVYCLPSYGEPFGMTALEAMACAKPVVATDAGGLRYLISDKGGRRVPPGDPEALAAALRELLLDPALRRSMGEHNRRLVEEHYGWSPVARRLEAIYREAIDAARGGPRGSRDRRAS